MTPEEIKAVFDHIASDAEAIATKLGKPEIAAQIKKFAAAAETPFVLEGLSLAINYGIEKAKK